MTIAETKPPKFSMDEAKVFVQELFAINVQSIESLGSFIDQNYKVTSSRGQQYTLKIHDGKEQQAVIDLQTKAARFLSEREQSIEFPVAIETVYGEDMAIVRDDDGQQYCIRLLSFIPGSLLKDITHFSDELLANIGQVLGRMDNTLHDFSHPAANRIDLPWDLKNTNQTKHLTSYINDPHKRRIADYFFLQFDTEVAPKLPTLNKSVVHNDSHRYSLLVASTDSKGLCGVIDFGDIVYTYTISNLAVALSDIMVQCDKPIESAAKIVHTYNESRRLSEDEISVLYYMICTRLSIYGCMSALTANNDPDNQHAQLKVQQVWDLLDRLLAANPLYAEDTFREACGIHSLQADREQRTYSHINMREKYFPKSMYTHYQQPLSLYKGALQYLYDDNGKTYLDCVNNVCQWGHCHPRIVRAAQQQIANLNTNSRYVYQQMSDYAERLLETFPENLNVCFFVNSGSEANDLAMRLARTYTNHSDMIVIDKAYHGNSSVCTDISPNRIDREGGPGLPDHVHSTLIPDTFRGAYREGNEEGTDNCTTRYLDNLRNVVDDIRKQGKGVAAFYAESLVGTAGQIVLPESYLQQAYTIVRNAGGLCIADEVQVGFGRTGEHMWCFESQQVVPDIVTMGKPIGNGHPMAAVVTTRAIAEAFDNGITYFNTFGGNPVSCATGLAVLDVLQEEQLQDNCLRMSELLIAGLRSLQSRHPIIADIRGQGLYIGMELISNLSTMSPATEKAQNVVEQAKDKGILLNTNGYDNNIIKIKPPLIINEQDVATIIDVLEQIFSDF